MSVSHSAMRQLYCTSIHAVTVYATSVGRYQFDSRAPVKTLKKYRDN